MIHPVIVHVDMSFRLSSFHSSWEICYENFQEWQNLKNLWRDITPRVISPWLPFCHYTFLTLETKCGISFTEVTEYVIENLQRDITPRAMDPWPLFWYTQYIQPLSMFIQIWKTMKGHNSKNYGPLATILLLHLTYLIDQVWYKFHRRRTTNIKVIKQNAF